MGKLRNAVLAAPEDDPVVDQNEEQVTDPTENTSTNEGGESNPDTPATTEDDPVDPAEEVTSEKIKQPFGYKYPGYDPSVGNESSWYEAIETVRPRVYHKYAKEDVYQTLYPDLINDDEEEKEEP